MSTKKLALLLGAAPLLLGAGDALAWVPIDGDQPTWDVIPVPYKIKESSIPASIAGIGVARVDAGFASWAGNDCTFFATENLGNTNSGINQNDESNVILWISANWPNGYGDVHSVIGITMPVWQQGGHFIDADIAFNDVG